MEDFCEKILLTEEEIKAKVAEISVDINRDYEGKKPLVVGVLTGAVVFCSDLIRNLKFPMELAFIKASSYGSDAVTSGKVIVNNIGCNVKGRDVLIAEDIVDTGLTLQSLKEILYKEGAKSVKCAALLDKFARRKVDINPDYCCFKIDDVFAIGYGLDYDGMYRSLPYIGVLKPSYYEK